MRRSTKYILRRVGGIVAIILPTLVFLFTNSNNYSIDIDTSANSGEQVSETADSGDSENITQNSNDTDGNSQAANNSSLPLATEILGKLEIKGRASKTNYNRTEFYSTWPTVDGCNLRQRIIFRDFGGSAETGGTATTDKNCNVVSGKFYEPYTGQILEFTTRESISKGIQIDHVVALSDAWQKGAQNLTKEKRYALATDPLNLLAVDSSANQQKSDGDAATWLPKNKAFRCQYVARQISVKYKYNLWVTQAEHDAIENILKTCPDQRTYE